MESFVCPLTFTFETSWEPMNSILRNSPNIAKILFRSYCAYDGSFCWFDNKHERWKGFSCWSIWGWRGTIGRVKWNLIFMFLSSMLVLWCRSEMTDSRGHDLHRNSMGSMFICFRTTERTLTIFGRNFPNEVWHSSHMTSDILMVTIWRLLSQQHPKGFECIHVSINEEVLINLLRKQTRRCENILCYISGKY